MYNWIVRRILERTSSPQPVYPAQVDAGVRLWMPAIALVAASFVTPAARKIDVRYEVQPPAASWIQATLPTGPTTAQAWPAVEAGTQRSYRTVDRARLDVRAYRWDSDFGLDTTQTTDIWTPVNNPVSTVTPKRAQYDVRSYEWAPSQAWLFTNLPPAVTTAQLWPAIEAGTQRSYRTSAAPTLDVRRYEWQPDSPSWSLVYSGIIRRFAPVFSSELDSYRLRDGARLDVRGYDWQPEPAWITTVQTPPVTQAQQWPAIADKSALYRTPPRVQYDVRGYEWLPAFSWVVRPATAAVASWAPIFTGELQAYRTRDHAVLDVRGYEWSPESGWVFSVVPVPPAATPRTVSLSASVSNAPQLSASTSNAPSLQASRSNAPSLGASE